MRIPAGAQAPRGSRPRAPLALLALAALLAAVTWPLLAPGRVLITDDGFVSDLTMAGLPFRAVLHRALAGEVSPFWCPGIYTGFPLHAAPEAGFYYAPNWILAFFGDAARAIHLGLFLHLLLAGAGVFLLLRDERLAPAPATFGALTFAAGGFLLAHLKHVAMVATAAWLPWLLLGTIRLAQSGGRKGFFLTAVAASATGLAGHPQIAYIGVVAGAVFYACYALLPGGDAARPGARPLLRGALLLAAAFVLGHAIAAPQHVPAALMARDSARADLKGTAFAEQIPLEPRNLGTWLFARAVGMAGDASYRGRGLHWEDYRYQGLAALPLALLGLATGFRRRTVRAWAATGLLSLLLALGSRGGLYELAVAVVPGLGWFRFPVRFLVVSELAVAVLAAIGLAWLAARLGRRGRRAVWPAAAVVLLALDLGWAQRPLNGYAPRAEWLDPPPTVGDVPPGARYLSLGAREAHVFAYEHARGWSDVRPLIVQRRFLQPSLNLLFGVAAADGYANPVPGPTAAVWGDHYAPGLLQQSFTVAGGEVTLGPIFFTLARLAEVRTVFSLWPLHDPRLEPLAARPPVFAYALPEPLPHAWFVPRAVRVGSFAAGAARLAAIDPEWETILLGGETGEEMERGLAVDPGASRVGIVRRSDADLVLAVDAPVAGWVRIAEAFDPGWVAHVDGKRVRVEEADLAFQAVPVAAGRHEVRLRYRPRGFALGLAAAAAGLLGLWVIGLRLAAPRGAG